MSVRAAAVIAWSVCGFCALIAGLMVVLAAANPGSDTSGLAGSGPLDSVAAAAAILAFAIVGALVISRRRSPIGWVFCATGLATAGTWFGDQYASYALLSSPGALPGGTAAEWVANVTDVPAFCLIGLVLLLFPHGRLRSTRWRPALWALVAGSLLGAAGYAGRAGPFDSPFASFTNPLGVAGARDAFDALTGLAWFLFVVGLGAALMSVLLQWRDARGARRQQLKWVIFAMAVLGAIMVIGAPTFLVSVSGTVNELRRASVAIGIAGVPVAAGIAILRYRLYDIDVVINRTLVYGGLTATLLTVYLGFVLLFELVLNPVTTKSDLAIAGSTLAVAALFRPARRRIQALVDRRFYRRKYDAQRTLQEFSVRLREQVDLDSLSAELRGVVQQTMQPAQVSLWLRGRAR